MNPKKSVRPGRLPFGECLALNKPCGSLAVSRFARDVVIFPWIGRRDPTSNVPLQFITCPTISEFPFRGGNINNERTFRPVPVARHLV